MLYKRTVGILTETESSMKELLLQFTTETAASHENTPTLLTTIDPRVFADRQGHPYRAGKLTVRPGTNISLIITFIGKRAASQDLTAHSVFLADFLRDFKPKHVVIVRPSSVVPGTLISRAKYKNEDKQIQTSDRSLLCGHGDDGSSSVPIDSMSALLFDIATFLRVRVFPTFETTFEQFFQTLQTHFQWIPHEEDPDVCALGYKRIKKSHEKTQADMQRMYNILSRLLVSTTLKFRFALRHSCIFFVGGRQTPTSGSLVCDNKTVLQCCEEDHPITRKFIIEYCENANGIEDIFEICKSRQVKRLQLKRKFSEFYYEEVDSDF